MFEDLNFSEAYANYKESEKLQFQQAAQRLLAVTYLNKNTGDLTRWDEDYLFIQKRQKYFTEFFSYLGMELTIHDSLQVISVESKFPAAKKKIDKATTLYCLALRLVFDEKIKEFSGSDQVMIRNADFIGKLSEYGITDRKISLQEYARIMRSLVKIGILQKSKGPWDDLDTSFLIFPAITLLLPENKMKDFVKSLKTIEGEAVYD